VAAVIEGFVTGRTGSPVLEVIIGALVALGYLTFLLFPGAATGNAGAPVSGT
jgi:hypothetical protein